MSTGFERGFDLGYEGPTERRSTSRNLPFTVGNKTILWNKLMKEVKLGRVAGPFDSVPFDYYIQSPIGLIPKVKGQQTRLIFHLSYDFADYKSVNFYMPKSKCSVKYNDLDEAIQSCLFHLEQAQIAGDSSETLWFGKTDAQSAFRVVPLLPRSWKWVVMKAEDLIIGIIKYFVDKCLPFGSSISCAIFRRYLMH